MDWTIVVPSAIVGAVVATFGQLFGQALERRHRERELIFRCSVDAAKAAIEQGLMVRKEMGTGIALPDSLYLAADYYPLVKALLTRGRHPKETRPPKVAPR